MQPADFDPAKIVLYDFEWQALRTDLDFSSQETTEASLYRLKKYLGNNKDINRVWRVLNLLAATRMGFSGQRVLSKVDADDLEKRDRLVKQERERLSKVYGDLKDAGHKFTIPTENQLVKDLKAANDQAYKRVFKSLKQRFTHSGESVNRPELAYYLRLMGSI